MTLPIIDNSRREFGLSRTVCGCAACVLHCRYLSGYLIPADLARMIPPDVDPLAWAEVNLRASPGALVRNSQTGAEFRIPTLVPAVRDDHSCIHLGEGNRCMVHAVAPFGCAFFDCQPVDDMEARRSGLRAIADEHGKTGSLYRRILLHLAARNLVVDPPEIRKMRLAEVAYLEDIEL